MLHQVETEVIRERLNSLPSARVRPSVSGKFLYVGSEKFYVRGVTYGTFRESVEWGQFPLPQNVRADFASMAANGVNAVRTYTVPPLWLLDEAAENGLYVMVGLPWEQHITFLDDSSRVRDIRARVRTGVRQCKNHPAVLSYAIGNEIPASIVRWHGRERTQTFLQTLYDCVKCEDPNGLATYVNFPTTEYLELDFLDFLSFNVYLETQDQLAAYLFRLQNLAGDRPLLMAEVGLDSRRNGESKQAETLDWQVRTVFSSGCTGMFVFAWTDEWQRGGHEIEDWDFGLVTRDRRPKKALGAVRSAFSEAPFSRDLAWPSVSVVVCSYNGSRTIRETLEHVTALAYPNYEVIVVNDGSTDHTPDIVTEFARQSDIRLITIENGGLSNARNVGMRAAMGDIVAYCDDDAYPDPHWLHYLAHMYLTTDYAGVGGPNLPPPGDGPIAEAVANAPGGPIHVLVSDTEAEHIPGCNSSYRKSCLLAVDGYDPTYRVAGDDVDLCWRIQQRGWKVGFHPAALVWHHRRNSIKAYWRQQRGYGKAEALLQGKWPEKYNALGHLAWRGRLYSTGIMRAVAKRWRVYHGVWGTGLFQSLYEPNPGGLQVLARMPEWYLVCAVLGTVSLLSKLWRPLQMAVPLLAVAIGLPVAQVIAGASRAVFPSRPETFAARAKLCVITVLLFMLQPLARLWGRVAWGLAPWRISARGAFMFPRACSKAIWSERWRSDETWLGDLESRLRTAGAWSERGGEFDDWDLLVKGGLPAGVRVTMGVEEHGGGKQLIRLRMLPRIVSIAGIVTLVFAVLTVWAAANDNWAAAITLGLPAAAWGTWIAMSCGFAQAAIVRALDEMSR